MAFIFADNINKSYKLPKKNDLKVLDGVSFSVEKNELVCLVGPSGCGKTTLLKILLDIITSDTGNCCLGQSDHEINEIKKRGISFIQQESVLLPWRTVIQNAVLGAEVRRELSENIVNRIKGTLGAYKLKGFEDNIPEELSGGMKQRVSVIRALESRPAILFCDEPFSAIDYVTRLELNTRFRYLTHVYQTTTLFVTHNIEEAIFLGDRIIVLSKRPARILNEFKPTKELKKLNTVDYRKADEFSKLFGDIWELLNDK